MPDLGISLSDQRVKTLMRRLESVYGDAMKTAVKNSQTALDDLASLTDEALEGMSAADITAKREAAVAQIKRTQTLQKRIAAEISDAGKTAAQIIQGELTGIYALNRDFAAYTIQQQAGIQLDFTVYDRNQIAVFLQEQQAPFTKIAYRRLGADKVIITRLQNQFIAGIMNGESQPELIRRIQGVTGQSVRQAKRVAQTERNRVQSQGRQMAIDEANDMGVKVDRQWIARMRNTRDAHEEMHMTVAAPGKKFRSSLGAIEFPGDPNASAENTISCYCYIKPMVQSVSPALAKHRAMARDMTFQQYRSKVATGAARGTSQAVTR